MKKIKMKILFTGLFAIYLLYNNSFAQSICDNNFIIGPLSTCNISSNPTQTYTVSSTVAGGFWTWVNAGSITYPAIDKIQLTWSSVTNSSLSYHYPVSTTYPNGCVATIRLQPCCNQSSLYAFDTSPFELFTNNTFGTNFLTNSVPANPNSGVYTFKNATFQFDGVLDCRSQHVKFENCTVKMGEGSVIYIWNGGGLIGFNLELRNAVIEASGCNKMWQGIRPWVYDNNVKLTANSEINDAQYALQMKLKMTLISDGTKWKRNYVSIYTPPNYYNHFLGTSPIFINNEFDGSAPLVGTYSGQTPVPLGGKSYAGMMLYELGYAQNPVSIPTGLTPGIQNRFHDLNYGIYGINSYLDVFNCDFQNILPVAAYQSRGSYGGTAIYSLATVGATMKELHAGDANTTTINKSNRFINCGYGVVAKNNIDCYIKRNDFVENNIGVYVNSIVASKVRIEGNHFADKVPFHGCLNFASTGVIVENKYQTYKDASITGNEFEDVRIGIYVARCNGQSTANKNFNIDFNTITSTTPAEHILTLNCMHYGIWLNNVFNAGVSENSIVRTIDGYGGAFPNFQNLMRGINANTLQQTLVKYNTVQNYGAAARFIGNCNGTFLQCNAWNVTGTTFNNFVRGVNLVNATLPAQAGASGNGLGNSWNGFQTPASNIYNRVYGTTATIFNWRNQGAPNSTTNSNPYSPAPVSTNVIFPIPYSSAVNCSLIPSTETAELISIAQETVQYQLYAEESKYLNEVYLYNLLDNDAELRESEPAFQPFYSEHLNGNIGKFAAVNHSIDEGET